MVDPGDKDAIADRLIRLLLDPRLRAQMGAAGRARAEAHFDNEVVVSRLVSIWRELSGAGD